MLPFATVVQLQVIEAIINVAIEAETRLSLAVKQDPDTSFNRSWACDFCWQVQQAQTAPVQPKWG